MTTITVTNRKGGTGKTTHSVHLAAGLAIRGYRVGIVDADSQGNIASTFGFNKQDGLYEVIVNDRDVKDVAFQIPSEYYYSEPIEGELFLLPASGMTYKIPFDHSDPFCLMKVINQYNPTFSLDYVVVDTNPTVTGFDAAIGMATDAYLFVTEAETLSIEGLNDAITQMHIIAENRQEFLSRETKFLGVLPNKVRIKTALHQHGLERLHEAYPGKVWEPIPLAITWGEASLFQRLVYNHPESAGVVPYANYVVDMVLRGLSS